MPPPPASLPRPPASLPRSLPPSPPSPSPAPLSRHQIRIAEYTHTDLADHELTAADIHCLRGMHERGLLESFTEIRLGWRLKSKDAVGVINLDRIRLVIEPKFAISGDQLSTWLPYALAAPEPLATPKSWQLAADGYVCDLVIHALVSECRTLLSTGLRRDYVRLNTVEPALRGRLDIAAQATRRYGQLDRFHLRTFDRNVAIWENHLCAAALTVAAKRATDPKLARDAADTAARFPPCPDVSRTLDQLRRNTYTRLNQQYRTAHAWSELLLKTGGPRDLLLDAGHTAPTLLLKMNSLWEKLVRRMTQEAAARLGGTLASTSADHTAIRTHGDLSGHQAFRPDCLVEFPATPAHPITTGALIPIDAKYIRYDKFSVGADNLHQLLTYVSGYARPNSPTPSAAIVHPSVGHTTTRILSTNGPYGSLGKIYILGIDVTMPPPAGVSAIETLLNKLLCDSATA